MQTDNDKHINALSVWAKDALLFPDVMPDSLKQARKFLEQDTAPGQLSGSVALSQRQIERLFKRWLQMTLKHYQRILRIKKTIYFLRLHNKVSLADVSQQFGFSDQAHMTREFRAMACTTPSRV